MSAQLSAQGRCYVDLHYLQTVPPSCLNRGETGSPKTAMYGGHRRARVSSQAWNRPTRLMFTEHVPRANLGTRTATIAALLTARLRARAGLTAEDATRLANALLLPLGITPSQKKANETSYLLYFGYDQLDAIVDLVADRIPALIALSDKELAATAKDIPVTDELKHGHPVDVALFGRMVADLADLNVDSSIQVMHAISTHTVETDWDFFTAVDDEQPDNETGAAMMGTVELTSATLYRYATVAVHTLYRNLGGDRDTTIDTIDQFVDCFTRSMPTGKQTSTAPRTLPHLVVAALRHDQNINLCTAFENPVRPRGGSGIADLSAARLAAEFAAVSSTWASSPVLTAATYSPDHPEVETLTAAFGPPLPFLSDTDPNLRHTVRAGLVDWFENGHTR